MIYIILIGMNAQPEFKQQQKKIFKKMNIIVIDITTQV